MTRKRIGCWPTNTGARGGWCEDPQFSVQLNAFSYYHNAIGGEVIGRKVGNKLIVAGEEFHEHEGYSSEPLENESSEDAD